MNKTKTVQQKKTKHYSVKVAAERDGFFIKDVSTSSSIVTGFYGSYNYFDSDGDVLIQGCAKKSIQENGPESNAIAKIKHACDHDLTRIPGKIQVLKESSFRYNGINVPGIYFETKMASTTLGQDTLKNYLDGIVDNHSIGFRYMDLELIEKGSDSWAPMLASLINPEDADHAGYMFVVKEIKLYEGSSVAFGANSLTPYLGAKSENKDAQVIGLFNRMDKLTKLIKSGKQSDDMLSTFEIQVMQIKQMISEIIKSENPKKSAEKGLAEKTPFTAFDLVNNFSLT